MRALEFLTVHVIFKLCFNQIYQLKTTLYWLSLDKKKNFAVSHFAIFMSCRFCWDHLYYSKHQIT